MTTADPVKTIKEYKEKGYTIELSVDSMRNTYAVKMMTQHDVRRFTIPIKNMPIQLLHDALRGL